MSEQKWFGAINDQLKKSGTFSNVILGFIEVVGEKFLEVEFSCPCKPIINSIYSSGFFLLPALLSFVLIRISQNCTDCTKRSKRCVTALVPAVVWLLITFLDGRYFVCLIAYGRGTFNGSRHTEGLAQPCNMKAETMTENETLDLIKQYTAISQAVGAGILLLLFVVLLRILISGSPAKDDNGTELQKRPETGTEKCDE